MFQEPLLTYGGSEPLEPSVVRCNTALALWVVFIRLQGRSELSNSICFESSVAMLVVFVLFIADPDEYSLFGNTVRLQLIQKVVDKDPTLSSL